MTIDRRIRKGIALLDADGPLDWRRKITAAIRAKRFDLSDSKHCVLGEIYGDYEIGLDRLGMKDVLGRQASSRQYGFVGSFDATLGEYERLTHGWIRLYQKGQKAAKKMRRHGT